MPLALTYFAVYPILALTSPYLSILIRDLGFRPEALGLFLGAFEIAGIAGPIFAGRLIDRIGRFRPGLALAYCLILVSIPLFLFFRHPLIVLAAVILLSIGSRSVTPIVDTAATIAIGPKGNYGKYRWAGSFSFVLMALFLQFQPWIPVTGVEPILFWLAATTVFAFCFLSILPERDPRDRNAASRPTGGEKQAPRRFVDGPFIIGLAIIALSRLAMSPINGFFSLYLVEELHWNVVALMWAFAATVEIPIMFFSTPLIARFGAPKLLAFSSAAVFVRLLVYTLIPNAFGAVIGQALHAFCYGLFHPAAISFIATRVPPERRATGMAMYLSLGSGLPTFLGNVLGGFILAAAGYRIMFASFIIFAVASVALYISSRRILDAPTRAW
ncbi:MAG: MFS transporter [Treponemataceae bacterium]